MNGVGCLLKNGEKRKKIRVHDDEMGLEVWRVGRSLDDMRLSFTGGR